MSFNYFCYILWNCISNVFCKSDSCVGIAVSYFLFESVSLQFLWLSFKMVGLCMQWWASKVGINYELICLLTILPAISLIPCKITVLAVLGFMFFFLYQKLSLFAGIICPLHIPFHLHFHNSFKYPHFILHSCQRFPYLSSCLQFTTTATFGTSPCTYSVPNHSVHFNSVLAYATSGTLRKLPVHIKSFHTENFIYVLYMWLLFSHFTCFPWTHINFCSLAKIFTSIKCANLVQHEFKRLMSPEVSPLNIM